MFVTHDIDEAITLGDRVAVFGPGGVLQQYDAPARLLSNPANEFVAGFIGADRGYRGLQFRTANDLPLHAIATVTEAEIDGLALQPGEWRLVLRTDGRAVRLDQLPRASSCIDRGSRCTTALIAGGSLFRPDGTMRLALDSALSSPSGLGVAVDADEQVIGGVKADDVLDALGGSSGMNYLLTHLDKAWALTVIHLRLSLIPVVLGLVIAVPLGAYVWRPPRCGG